MFPKWLEGDFYKRRIFCYRLESHLRDLKSGREAVCSQPSVLFHSDCSLDRQTRDDCVTPLHTGVLPAPTAPAAGKALQVINSSPAIQDTTWLLCSWLQQPGLCQAPAWKSLNSFLHCLSWRTTHHKSL